MKHILNNLSEEEKNSIREQHTGGMKVMTENFSKLIESKLGDSKPLINEQPEQAPVATQQQRRTAPLPPQRPPMNGNQYKKPPYCKVGQSQGTIVTAQTGTGGPNTALGETGLALSVNNKEICLISTKYPQGGYVAIGTRK